MLGAAVEQWKLQANPLADRLTVLARARVGLIYWWRHGRWPALARPQRFTEWVQWRKLNDRDPARARLTDKAHGKSIAAAALGEAFIIPTLWEGERLPVAAPWPMPFVVKANHGCGQNVIVRTPADYRRACRIAPAWLDRAYGGWLDEWHYRGARRSILVEPFIGAVDTLPIDYKVYVFGGRAMMVQVHEDRGDRHRWSQYDIRWKQLSSEKSAVSAPRSLTAMLGAAERLGQGHDFLRVDFYDIDGVPLFGEFCLYPGSGLDRFDPVSLDDWLGAQWGAERHVQPVEAGRARPGSTELEPQMR